MNAPEQAINNAVDASILGVTLTLWFQDFNLIGAVLLTAAGLVLAAFRIIKEYKEWKRGR